VAEFFKFYGFETNIPIITASTAAALYARQNYKNVAVYCDERVKRIFAELLDYNNPQAVIIGDYGKKWDFKTLNEIFLKVFNGADLIAMQKNRYWSTQQDDLLLDAGPFVAAIEYATNKKAVVIGKPSMHYFYSALRMIGFDAGQQFIMVGDDPELDIEGAKKLGADTIFISTGKVSEYPSESEVQPDFKAGDLNDVIEVLKNHP
jgi:HAD superfamily hydrolase (TIGR01458 family)